MGGRFAEVKNDRSRARNALGAMNEGRGSFMRYRILASWIAGLSMTAAVAAVDCGGDDTTPGATGTTGTGGTSTTGGRGGAAGMTGTAGNGGAATGGSGGGGTAGSAGSAGAPPDAGDAAIDRSPGDAADGGQVPFSAVTEILTTRCIACHRSNDGATTGLVDYQTAAGLYTRLTTPLPDGQEGMCGFGDGGADSGDAARSNRVLIVPGDTGASFMFLKITGAQPPGNPPAGCGVQMPRVRLIGDDGGPAGTVSCAQADGGAAANCLSQTQIDTIRNWILQGAPNN
jgi:hypothetical protein